MARIGGDFKMMGKNMESVILKSIMWGKSDCSSNWLHFFHWIDFFNSQWLSPLVDNSS
jgi:hypothetical protein